MKQSCPQNLLHVVGLGLNGLESLTPGALACLKKAEVIAGSKVLLQVAVDYPAQKLPLGSDITAWIEQIAEMLQQKSVVVLASGDPLFFGLGRLLTERFERQCLRFYPHVSSVQLAFNRLGIPWQSATIVSVHGRQPDRLEQALKQGKSPLAVLTDFTHTPGAIARLIHDLHPPVQYRMTVCSQLGAAAEAIQSVSIEEAINRSFPSPNVVVLEEIEVLKPLYSKPLFGIADEDFHTFPDQPGLITKREVRTLSLSLMQLQPKITVWDVGAGTGSISIEIARLMPDARIYAIEKTAIGFTLIQKNCHHFATANVMPIRGIAPDALKSLPDPDRIVIGGGGKAMPEILKVCGDRLRPNGVIVANFATLETCVQAKQILESKGWIVQLLQVNIARSATLASATRFVPLNPVILLQASRPSSPSQPDSISV